MSEEEDKERKEAEESSEPQEEPQDLQQEQESAGAEGNVASSLGAARYVMAGFFAAAIAVAYVIGRAITTGWNKIAESQWGIDKTPWLSRVTEDHRDTWGHLLGGLVAIAALVYVYRRQDIRTWVNEAAGEMAKVTWPSKKEVTNGTIVVVVASLVATIYLALLDRFWGFVTNLVYGA
jgi:preprotein translocase subunit SecE